MKYLMWLLKAAIFFTLFAFALNNQQTVSVHFFFGTAWQRTARHAASSAQSIVSEQPSTLHHGI
ncbi:MAG: hypothetical protein B7Y54_03045 [Polaromonas sp. 35-63-240]|nr:MAG: hypothetical protein B7Y54_03045 [Polaromonas sp. 35-63-240]